MSIWSSFASIDELYEGGYGDDLEPSAILDLAETGMRARGDRIRLWIDMPSQGEEVTVVLHRQQVEELRDELDAWLNSGPPCPRCGRAMIVVSAPVSPEYPHWTWGCTC